MSGIRFDCSNDTCARVSVKNDGSFDPIEVDTAIQGDLLVHLGDREENFQVVPLLMVSGALVDQALKLLMFLEPGRRRTIVVPDHAPFIGVKIVDAETVEVSVVEGSHVLARAECQVAAYLRAVGDFHQGLVHRLLHRNPDLLGPSLLWSSDPVVTLLLEHRAQRRRPEVLD